MYIPKDINRRLKEEAKRAGRTNMEGLVVAPAWSKLFLQADYVIAKQANEIERLRETLQTICNGQRDADKSYAELFAEIKTEARAALKEIA